LKIVLHVEVLHVLRVQQSTIVLVFGVEDNLALIS